MLQGHAVKKLKQRRDQNLLGAGLNKISMMEKVGSVREMQLRRGVSGAQMENHHGARDWDSNSETSS